MVNMFLIITKFFSSLTDIPVTIGLADGLIGRSLAIQMTHYHLGWNYAVGSL